MMLFGSSRIQPLTGCVRIRIQFLIPCGLSGGIGVVDVWIKLQALRSDTFTESLVVLGEASSGAMLALSARP